MADRIRLLQHVVHRSFGSAVGVSTKLAGGRVQAQSFERQCLLEATAREGGELGAACVGDEALA